MRKFCVTTVLAGACALGGVGCSKGGSSPVEQQAAKALRAVPQKVMTDVKAEAKKKHPTWGEPTGVLRGDGKYVFFFATPESERRRGKPRLLIVRDQRGEDPADPTGAEKAKDGVATATDGPDRVQQLERLRRLQEQRRQQSGK